MKRLFRRRSLRRLARDTERKGAAAGRKLKRLKERKLKRILRGGERGIRRLLRGVKRWVW